MRQRWERLLFAHWPVDPDRVRPLVPGAVELDLRDGSAWLTVTPHRIVVSRARRMLEVSVRTYVVGERPGVCFLSLDTDSRLGRWGARLYGIGYERRPLSLRQRGDWLDFESPRFSARYRALGEPFVAEPGTLDWFLHERACLYRPDGRRIDVELAPWRLQPAEAEIAANELAPHGEPALVRYCHRQDARLGWARPLEQSSRVR